MFEGEDSKGHSNPPVPVGRENRGKNQTTLMSLMRSSSLSSSRKPYSLEFRVWDLGFRA